MSKTKPDQSDWDLHLVRSWYADKFQGMRNVSFAFHSYWGVFPDEAGLDRHAYGSSIAIWKFVESIPPLNKALHKYGKDRFEELARKTTEANPKCKFEAAKHVADAERRAMKKAQNEIDSSFLSARLDKRHNV